jgi:hypothetical protein
MLPDEAINTLSLASSGLSTRLTLASFTDDSPLQTRPRMIARLSCHRRSPISFLHLVETGRRVVLTLLPL